MKKYRAIVQSNTEPSDTNVIWKSKDKLLYYDGGWKDLLNFTASNVEYKSPDGDDKTVKEALDYVYKYVSDNDGPTLAPQAPKLTVTAKLSKSKISLGTKVYLLFDFSTVYLGNYTTILKLSKFGLSSPFYEEVVGPFSPSVETGELGNTIDLTPILESNSIQNDLIEVSLTVVVTPKFDGGGDIASASTTVMLEIGDPEYTMIEMDETILDETSMSENSKGNITNLENNTGAKTSTTYVPSGHIKSILSKCHRYLGKVTNFGDAVSLEGNPNDTNPSGVSFVGRKKNGTMHIIKLADEDSRYFSSGYNSPALRQEASLSGNIGSGEVVVKIPGFWYKGINLNIPQNPNISLRYTCFCDSKTYPSESYEVKTITMARLNSDLVENGNESGLFIANKGLLYTQAADSINDRIPEDENSNYNIYRIDVEGFKKLRFPVSIADSVCSVFTDSRGKIITDSEGSVVDVGEVYTYPNSYMYNGMGAITTIPAGAKYFYMSLNKFITDTATSVEPCDIVLHKGLGYSSGDEMNETNAKEWIADMEPDWVYSDEVCIHAAECSYNSTSGLYTPFDGEQTAVKGGFGDELGLALDKEWTQFSMRDAAFLRGLQLIDYEATKLLAMLFMAKYGRRNSQYQLGSGMSSRTRKLGVTRAYGMKDTVIPSGLNLSGNYSSAAVEVYKVDGSPVYEYPGSPNFLGIENIHGNVAEWLDRCYYANEEEANCGKLRITMPNLTTRRVYGVTPSNTTPKSIVHGKYCDIISCSAVGGSEVTGYPDYQKTDNTLRDSWATTKAVSRSYSSYYASGGVFCLDGFSSVGYTDSGTGSRLMFRGDIKEVSSIGEFTNMTELRK